MKWRLYGNLDSIIIFFDFYSLFVKIAEEVTAYPYIYNIKDPFLQLKLLLSLLVLFKNTIIFEVDYIKSKILLFLLAIYLARVSLFLYEGNLPWLVINLNAPHLWSDAISCLNKCCFYYSESNAEGSLNLLLDFDSDIYCGFWILRFDKSYYNFLSVELKGRRFTTVLL